MDVYERTHSFSKKGCIVGATFATYGTLERWYVCYECGGNLLHKQRSVDGEWIDWAECVECQCRYFIPEWLYSQQCMEYQEIVDKLAPELRALLPEREKLDITADEAIADLYGL